MFNSELGGARQGMQSILWERGWDAEGRGLGCAGSSEMKYGKSIGPEIRDAPPGCYKQDHKVLSAVHLARDWSGTLRSLPGRSFMLWL